MEWLNLLTNGNVAAESILILSFIIILGLGFAAIKVRGLGIGVTGILIAGLIFGHFGFRLEPELGLFIQEFGLILFVFAVGLQIGPGFAASLRSDGLALNALASATVLGGALLALAAGRLFDMGPGASAGLFSGATTNTPSLGAGQQALRSIGDIAPEVLAEPALAYAVAYPAGIAGIIGSIVLLQHLFRVRPEKEAEELRQQQKARNPPLERATIRITNENLDGIAAAEMPGLGAAGVVLSRRRPASSQDVELVRPDTILHVGDLLLAVGKPKGLEDFQKIAGAPSNEDLLEAPGVVEFRRISVTNRTALGQSLADLGLLARYGVSVTRIERHGIEVTASAAIRLQFADVLQIVGSRAGLEEASKALGNSPAALKETRFLPVFVGIALGVLVGLIPFGFPGLPFPIRIGLAGGPLLIAIVLSRIGHIGQVVWYVPSDVNHALRDFGIALFLAVVGLKAGGSFADTLLSRDGLLWLGTAAVITVVPLVCVGLLGRYLFKLNFATISGTIAGSMTDPPALSFAAEICKSDLPATAYAQVYPLTMLLRILCAQLIVMLLA